MYLQVSQFAFEWSKTAPVEEVIDDASRRSDAPFEPRHGCVVLRLTDDGRFELHRARFDTSD